FLRGPSSLDPTTILSDIKKIREATRLGVASIELETTSEIFAQSIFFFSRKMLPKIGAAGPALAAGPWISPRAPCITIVMRAGNGAGKRARMPEQGRIALIVIVNPR